MSADLGPPRSECGIGGLVAFAGRLWAMTYLSHRKRTGSGTGLYEIDENLRMTKRPESYPGTYANRFVHHPSNQLFIGPWVIDPQRHVRTIEALKDVRLAGTATHLTDPKNKVLMLGMEGEFLEVDVQSLQVTQLDDLCKQLDTPGEGRVHFKDIFTGFGRVVVADNTYDQEEFLGQRADGRLAEWDGSTWTILDRNPYVAINGLAGFAKTMGMFALGWDRASVILKVFVPGQKLWKTYRLPKASHCFDHMWATEWPRIRSVEHERLLMDMHGMFYELPPHVYDGHLWGLRPISTHLWVVPDFCNFRGLFVMSSDDASFEDGANVTAGEPHSGLWIGKMDDLWNFGKPAGWGGPWWETSVQAHQPSDPYLMTGFDKKVLHVTADRPVNLSIEVDFMGCGKFVKYLDVSLGDARTYAHHEFPVGFSAHWIRVTADRNCVATAQLHYT